MLLEVYYIGDGEETGDDNCADRGGERAACGGAVGHRFGDRSDRRAGHMSEEQQQVQCMRCDMEFDQFHCLRECSQAAPTMQYGWLPDSSDEEEGESGSEFEHS